MEKSNDYFRKFLVWDRNAFIRIFVLAGLLCFFLPFATVEYKQQAITLSGFEAILPGVFADTWLKILPINWILLVTFLLGVATFFTVNESEKKEAFVLIPLASIAGIIIAAATIRPYYGIEVYYPMTWNIGMYLPLLCFGICFVMEWSNIGSGDSKLKSESNDVKQKYSAMLFCQKGKYIGGEFQLQKNTPLVIGRESEIANIVLDEKDVSRKHCVLLLDENKLNVKDCSTYGTYVNGEKISKEEERTLEDGDKLKVASNEFLVILSAIGHK